VRYRIRVSGRLDPAWSTWFDGLVVTDLGNGETELSGPLPDQAALHGALAKVRDLGLTLLAVTAEPAANLDESHESAVSTTDP